MQRSRKALLHRRVLKENGIHGEKKDRLYKVTLSVVIGLWGSVFLLNLWISHGDNHTDEPRVPVNKSIWNETELGTKNGSNRGAELSYKSLDKSDLSASSTSSEDQVCSTKSISIKEDENNISFVKDTPNAETGSLRTELEKETSKCKNQVETPAPGITREKETPKTEMPVETSALGTKQGKETVNVEAQVENPTLGTKQEKESPKSERLSRAAPLGLDEFKSRASSPKGNPVTGSAGIITHRLETGGAEHNYASASKGAKVLAFNKEAKGASNILGKDKDKYLRNPCSAEEKFVVFELSEETLVDTIEIANFEHHSSNLKEFELLGSSVYPTDKWVSLGNFTAGNVKHAQRFILQDPKWVRYLKLNLLSHYGAEFFCTVSCVQVYGIDAVERMLEDLISDQDHPLEPEQSPNEAMPKAIQPDITARDEFDEDFVEKANDDIPPEKSSVKSEVLKNNVPDAVETRPPQAGRLPGDTALKILMQKVRSLDLNLLILERYLEELNSRYGNIFKELDDEIDSKDKTLEKIRADLKSCSESNEINVKDVTELMTWKSLVSLQVDNLVRDNSILRSEVGRVIDNQRHMENKGLVIFVLSSFFGFVAFTKLLIDMVVGVFRLQRSRKFCGISSSWVILLLSCIVIFVLLL